MGQPFLEKGPRQKHTDYHRHHSLFQPSADFNRWHYRNQRQVNNRDPVSRAFKKKYSRVWLVGNIGESFLDKLPKIKSKDIIVAELSSFQLEDLALAKKSPNIAIITNIFPDHLNRYSSFQEYAQAKTHIFLHQKPAEHLIIDGNDEFLVKLTKKPRPKNIFLKRKICRL